nr:translesion error-prone DNA polymerase V autoproteolytic subunit [Serratia symbiotica]
MALPTTPAVQRPGVHPGKTPPSPQRQTGVRLLHDTGIACGFPSPAQDYLEQRLSLDDICIRFPESTYLVRADGHSMRDAGILDSDLLVVECCYPARHGDIVIATVDGAFTCKRLQLHPRPLLLPANPAFAPIEVDNEDMETVIFGAVRYAIHTL